MSATPDQSLHTAFVFALLKDAQFIKQLVAASSASEVEALAVSLFAVSYPLGWTLPLPAVLLEREFASAVQSGNVAQ